MSDLTFQSQTHASRKVSLAGQKGFTIIEILVAMCMSVVVGSILYSINSSNMKLNRSQKIAVDMNQNIRSALYVMKRELQLAGYDPQSTSIGEPSNAGITTPLPPASGATVESDSITFTYVADGDALDNDNDTIIDESDELATITFALYDPEGTGEATTLGRTDRLGTTPTIPIAENIEHLQFSLETAAADEGTLIRITMLVRANKEDKSFFSKSDTTYEVPDSSGTKWLVPAGDSFRRKLVTTVVKCRNTGV